MFQENQILSSLILDHLGLISSVIDKIGLISKIDARLPVSEKKGTNLTMEELVAGMILNGLGFIDSSLYMFPEFLDNRPVDRLFRSDIRADIFNYDTLGSCLDAISDYNPTKLFSEIAFEIGKVFNLLSKTAHLDITNLNIFVDYEGQNLNIPTEKEEDDFKVMYSYSKNSRPDLKQMVLNIATIGSGYFPIWMESYKGNASDKVLLKEETKFCKQIKDTSSFLFVPDSAMYEKCVINNLSTHWVSRVPATISQAETYLQMPNDDINWKLFEKEDKISSFNQVYKGVAQRWL